MPGGVLPVMLPAVESAFAQADNPKHATVKNTPPMVRLEAKFTE